MKLKVVKKVVLFFLSVCFNLKIIAHSLLRENPKYFLDVGGDNQQPRLHMGDYDGNFEIGKIINDATTVDVKVESSVETSYSHGHSVRNIRAVLP